MNLPWNAPLADRFWDKVETGEGCWLWTGTRTAGGYGQILLSNRKLYAHRVSWMLHYGPIPHGGSICHHCDTPACVRPEHLFLGTQTENMRDCARKHRTNNYTHPEAFLSGEEVPSAKVTWAQVAVIRRLYATGLVTQVELARRFGLQSHRTIGAIVHQQNWRGAQSGGRR